MQRTIQNSKILYPTTHSPTISAPTQTVPTKQSLPKETELRSLWYANSYIFGQIAAAMTAILASTVLAHTTFKANRSSLLHFFPTVFTIHKSYLYVIDNQALYLFLLYLSGSTPVCPHKNNAENRRNSIQNFGDCLFIQFSHFLYLFLHFVHELLWCKYLYPSALR